MPCVPKIDQPEIDGNDIVFRGHCDGTCKGGGACGASFSLMQDVKKNKGAKITAAGAGPVGAFMRVTAEKDISDGEIVLTCSCEDGEKKTATYTFMIEHRTTIEDVILAIATLGVKIIINKVTG